MFGRALSLKKRRTDEVVEKSYWDGFFGYLEKQGNTPTLGYSSDGGYYAYNEVRRIAWKAGWEYCQEIMEKREKATWGLLIERNQIPGRVYAEAYGAMRIAAPVPA